MDGDRSTASPEHGDSTRDSAPTVVLAFDGLSFRFLDAFDLPNFEALRDRGVEAPLRSTHPPWTASAWASMYTGTDPSHHGVFSFFDFGDDYPPGADVVSRADVRAPALWNYLTSLGRPSIVLNMPVTHPAEPIEGVLVPGYLAPEETPGHPEGIRDELSAALDEPYRIYAETELADDDEAKLDGYVDLVRSRGQAAAHLLSAYDWELAVVQVQKTDAVFHNFDDEAAFERVYAAADEVVGRVLDAVDDDANVVVCSDHGMRPRDGYIVHVNEVLADHGLLETTTGEGSPSLGSHKREWLGAVDDAGDAGGPSLSVRLLSGIETAARTVGVSTGAVYGALERVGLGQPLLDLLPEEVSVGEQVDWAASKAYCRRGPELGVRINLEGREPDGVVPEAEYDTVRRRIVDALSGLRTPDGDRAFEFVAPREEVYDGPHASAAPDVLFRPASMNHGTTGTLIGRQFISIEEYGHEVDGVFVGAGPGFAQGASLDGLSLPDVAPIVMALLGQRVPDRMTGAVPDGLLRSPVERGAYTDVASGTDDVTPDDVTPDDDRVEERLRDLGYL